MIWHADRLEGGTMNAYNKWLDFSTRLAGVLDVTDARREKILEEVRGFINIFEDEDIHGWDTSAYYEFYGHADIGGIADDTTYFGHFHLDGDKGTGFYNQISAITRAGLDVATEDWGGGVLGFTVGDIRKAYDGRIPEWVAQVIEISIDDHDDIALWL